MLEPNEYVVLNGEFCSCIIVMDDKPFDIYDLEKNGYQTSHIIGPEYYGKRTILYDDMDEIYNTNYNQKKIHDIIYLIQINKEGIPVHAKSYYLGDNIKSDNVDRSIDCVKEFVMTEPVIQVAVSENFDINTMSLFLRNMSKLENGHKFLFLTREYFKSDYREYRWYSQINRSYYPKILELNIDELNELPDIEYEKLKQDYKQDNYSLGNNPSLILYEPQYMRDNSLESFDFYFKNKDNLPKGYYSFDFDWKKISTYRLRNIIHPKTIIATHHIPAIKRFDRNSIPARTEYNCVFHRRDMDKEQSEYKKNLLANKSSWLSNEENEGFQDYRQYYLSSSRDYIPEDVIRDFGGHIFDMHWSNEKISKKFRTMYSTVLNGTLGLGYEIGFCMVYNGTNYDYSKKIANIFAVSNLVISKILCLNKKYPIFAKDDNEDYKRIVNIIEPYLWKNISFLNEYRGLKIEKIDSNIKKKFYYMKRISKLKSRYYEDCLDYYKIKDVMRLCKKYCNEIEFLELNYIDYRTIGAYDSSEYGFNQDIQKENEIIYQNLGIIYSKK